MRGGVTVVFLAGVLLAQTTGTAPKGAVRGVVKDTTGAPLAGISVQLSLRAEFGPTTVLMSDGRAVGVTAPPESSPTDGAGRYAFTGLRAGTYSLKPECDATAKRVELDADQETILDFVCPANPAIRGHVAEPNKDPAVDAFVWLLKSEYQDGALKQIVIGPKVTGEDGSYAFDTGLEPNRRYYVLVDREVPEELVTAKAADPKDREPIDVPTFYPSATRVDSATPVVLQPGENREQVDVKIAAAEYHCIEGKISTSGAPTSSNFAVQDIALAGTRLVRLRSSSGEDGKYHVCGLPAGSYRLSTEGALTEFAVTDSDMQHVDLFAEAAHLTLRVEWVDPPAAPKLDETGQAILRRFAQFAGMGDAPSGADLDQLAIRFRRLSPDDPDAEDVRNLAARVSQSHEFTDEQIAAFSRQMWSRPDMVGVTLAGATNGLSENLTAEVPSESPFRDGISAGDYTVHVQPFGPSFGYAKEVGYNGVKLTDEIVRIAPGATGTLHVVMARDWAMVSASVVDSDGKPVPNATVIVVSESVTSVPALSRLVSKGQTDQNGGYTSRPLAPGKYRVLAITQPVRWGVPEDLEKVLLVMFQAKEIELDGKATLEITLEPVPI